MIVRARYDGLIERFLTEEAVFVVDNGAAAFLPFWTFIVESDIITMLREAGRRVYNRHSDQRWRDAERHALGLKMLAETAAEKSLVVWINEYFGSVALTERRSTGCRSTWTTVRRS